MKKTFENAVTEAVIANYRLVEEEGRKATYHVVRVSRHRWAVVAISNAVPAAGETPAFLQMEVLEGLERVGEEQAHESCSRLNDGRAIPAYYRGW